MSYERENQWLLACFLGSRVKKIFLLPGGIDWMLPNLKLVLAVRKRHRVELALSLGISPSLLSEILNERRQASHELRARIAKALDADEGWLFARVTRIPSFFPSREASADGGSRRDDTRF
jgi:hypothetical protein